MINSRNIELDSIDNKILSILQSDASTSIQDIANQVGLTNNPCWRRIKRLESDGVIARRVAVINPLAIGLGTIAFVQIKIDSHNKDWADKFAVSVNKIPEIVECHRMTGDVDYLLKMVLRDLVHYDQVYQRLIALVPGLIDVKSTFSMELLKGDTVIDTTTA